MSPIPPVSSPPLTSKTKELAENENLDVSHTITLYLLYLSYDVVLFLAFVNIWILWVYFTEYLKCPKNIYLK